MDIDRGELRSERGIAAKPAGIVVSFQPERRRDPNADTQIAVALPAKDRLRDVEIRNDVVDAGVATVIADEGKSIERRSRQRQVLTILSLALVAALLAVLVVPSTKSDNAA